MFEEICVELAKLRDPAKARFLAGYFKTGKGEYGEGDVFLGITVPKMRKIAKKYQDLDFSGIQKLIASQIHEYRLLAVLILIDQYQKANLVQKRQVANFYIKNAKKINNWDLVDSSAPYILGDFLLNGDKKVLYKLAKSANLWERRIAIITTFGFIKKGKYKETLIVAEILLDDSHDLIHKAVGWMLREVGKRDSECEMKFLNKYASVMPRTMLRYAIERFDAKRQSFYLNLR